MTTVACVGVIHEIDIEQTYSSNITNKQGCSKGSIFGEGLTVHKIPTE